MAKPKKALNGKSKRGRPAKKTVDKDDKAEVRRVEPSQMPLPGQNRILEAIANVKGYQDKIATVTGKLRAYFKQLKAEGMNPAVIKELIALERGDRLEQRAYYELMGIGLKATGSPFQLSVFDVAFKSPVAQAKAEGAAQGKAGRAPEPSRWAEGSEEHTAYMEAHAKANVSLIPGAAPQEEPDGQDEERAAAE